MNDRQKTKAQLIEELVELRQRLAEWETVEWEGSQNRIRDILWEMSSSTDFPQVLQVIYQEVKKLIPQTDGCSVQVIDEATGEWGSYQISKEDVKDRIGPLPGDAVVICWREQHPVYRPDLKEEDPYEEAELMWDPEKSYSPAVRAVLDVPFKQGSLAVNSIQPHAFSSEHVGILQEIAQILSEGFVRTEDLRSLERRNQELRREIEERKQAEAALEFEQAQLLSIFCYRTLFERVVDGLSPRTLS